MRPSVVTDRPLRLSYADFEQWANEDVHAEWVDGEVIVQMPAGTLHQALVGFLFGLVSAYVRFYQLGRAFTAPYEMRTGASAREPDVLFVANEHLQQIAEQRLDGAADLVIEVISTESVARDRGDKFYEYQDAGVREYWIIDPRPGKERADFWLLGADGKYQPVPLDADGVYRSTVVAGFWFDTAWLFADPLPDPQFIFAEIAGFPAALVEELRKVAERGPQVGN